MVKSCEVFVLDMGKSVKIKDLISKMIINSGLTIKDAIIRYSNVGKADSCDELWSGCDEITGQLKNQSQVHGASAVVLCKPADADNEGTCENLGYPQNPRPF